MSGILITLVGGAIAVFALMILEWQLKRNIEKLEERVDKLEEKPSEDPFADLK